MSRHPERIPVRPRAASTLKTTAFTVAVLGMLALVGCSDLDEFVPVDPTPSATATTTGPPATPSPSASAAPALVPEGTAADNLPLFSAVTAAVWASPENDSGRAYIDALVAAGFDKAAMQVTNDRSTVGNPAESIQFSVRWGEECLIGQVGPATGDPVAVVVPVLAEGTCLVGQTRPIDW